MNASVLLDPLAGAVIRRGSATAVVSGDRSLTFADLDDRIGRCAGALRARGVRRGDRVALLARNELEYVEIVLGCQRIGAIAALLNFRLHPVELAGLIGFVEPALLIAGSDLVASVPPSHAAQTLILGSGDGDAYDDAVADVDPLDRVPLDAEAVTTLYFTGGTTGVPKAVELNNGVLAHRLATVRIELGLAPDQRFLQVQPMFHLASIISLAYLSVGSATIQLAAFDPVAWITAVHDHAITDVLVVPTMIAAIVDHLEAQDEVLRDLRLVHYSASPISPALLDRATRALDCRFVQTYGLTEVAAITVLESRDHDPVRRPDLLASAGRPIFDAQVGVVAPDGTHVSVGQVGEVVCRGPGVMTGYWRNEVATADAVKDGWFHTGDLGRMDGNGYLFLTDRKKDMIVTGGENVYPREVEDALASHPAVAESAVIALPSLRWGEQVHAVVVVRPGHDATEADLIAHVKSQVASYKAPKSIEFALVLPKSAVGKVLRRVLRDERAADQPA